MAYNCSSACSCSMVPYFLFMPDISAPAFNTQIADDTPSMLPLLFVTIAPAALCLDFTASWPPEPAPSKLIKSRTFGFVGYLGAVGEKARWR